MLDEIRPEAGAFYVVDRGYVDFGRLYVFTLSAAFFVTPTKKNVLLQRRYSHELDKGHRHRFRSHRRSHGNPVNQGLSRNPAPYHLC